ncbi:hypothetical protein RCL1_000615 [Eukaryota sp. TZLM3-RCL]
MLPYLSLCLDRLAVSGFSCFSAILLNQLRSYYFSSFFDGLFKFSKSGNFPAQRPLPGLSEVPYSRLRQLWSFLLLKTITLCWCKSNNKPSLLFNTTLLKIFLNSLKPSGVYLLCGLRLTAGSLAILDPCKAILPPPQKNLIEACNKQFKKTRLTIAGRALTKHFVRDSSKSFWNSTQGSDEKKNQNAIFTVERILSDPTWINIHEIVGQVVVLEIRTRQGYGARWELHPQLVFRGFLEPTHLANHSTKWRH